MSTVHRFPIRVYYEDTDAGGIMYHASHVRFLERGRTEFLRDLGIHHSQLMASETGALLFIVRRMELDYLKPARLDDLLTVTTELVEMGAATLLLDQRLLRGEALLLKSLVTVATIGADGRPKRLTPEMRARLGA